MAGNCGGRQAIEAGRATSVKTYYINLDRSEDRRVWIENTAGRLGIEIVRIPAVDGQLIPDTELSGTPDFVYRHVKRPLTRGEIGCLRSHIKVWEQVADTDDEWAFVIEDDAHLSNGVPDFLATSDWIPPNADIVKAETNLTRQTLAYAVSGRAFGREVRALLSDHDGSAAYFISRRACLALLADKSANVAPVDMVLFQCAADRYHELNVFQIAPAIAIQDRLLHADQSLATLSSIIEQVTPRPVDEKPRGIEKIRKEARRVVRQAIDLVWRLKRRSQRQSITLKIPFQAK